MTRHRLILVACIVAIGLVAAACGSDGAQRAVVATTAATPTASTLSPGTPDPERPAVTWHETEIDGTALTYALVVPVPDGVDNESGPVPALLAYPPGGQTRDLVEFGLDGYWTEQAIERGWVVISPVAPDGTLFFQGSEALIPGLLEEVSAVYPPEGGQVHVAGVSNGGISSFRTVANYPELVASVVALPGFPIDDADLMALDTVEVPITMWAGENDTAWVESMLSVEARLVPLGKQVSATVVPDTGHVIPATPSFVADIWTALESAR